MDLLAIQDLKIVFGRVVKFDYVAFGSVENGVHFVALIRITRANAALPLRAHLAP